MYITLTSQDFINTFNSSCRKDSFTDEALGQIFDYYDGEDFELDILAICCEWTEYGDAEEACNQYAVNNLEKLDESVAYLVELSNGNILVHD